MSQDDKQVQLMKIDYLHRVYQESKSDKKPANDLFDDQIILMENLIVYSIENFKKFGLNPSDLSFSLDDLIKNYVEEINRISQSLKMINPEEQLNILTKAVEVLAMDYCETQRNQQKFLNQQLTTLNNLSIVYRQMNKFQQAQNCINSVIKLQESQQQQIQIIGSYLNQSVIYSEINKHDKASECIIVALQKVDFFKESLKNQENQQQLTELRNLEMIGYYNLGAEYEFTHKYDDAIAQYKKSREIAEDLKDQHLISKVDKALKQIESIQNK